MSKRQSVVVLCNIIFQNSMYDFFPTKEESAEVCCLSDAGGICRKMIDCLPNRSLVPREDSSWHLQFIIVHCRIAVVFPTKEESAEVCCLSDAGGICRKMIDCLPNRSLVPREDGSWHLQFIMVHGRIAAVFPTKEESAEVCCLSDEGGIC